MHILHTRGGTFGPCLLLLAFDAPAVLQVGTPVELLLKVSFRQREVVVMCELLRHLQPQSTMVSMGERSLPICLLLLKHDPLMAIPIIAHLWTVWILLSKDF